jgi:pyrroloquinoline-quinone synthase
MDSWGALDDVLYNGLQSLESTECQQTTSAGKVSSRKPRPITGEVSEFCVSTHRTGGMKVTSFSHNLEEIIHEKGLLSHPFYKDWTAGTLTIDQLREYAKQYYQFESAFPTFLSGIHARCPSLPVRQLILDNLWDEEHGEDNHPALWLRFCEALGLSPSEVKSATLLPETQALLDTFRVTSTSLPYEEGIAALFAYEVQAPQIAEQKIEGLNRYYGITEEGPLAFFTTHMTADVEHSDAERQIIDDYATTSEHQQSLDSVVRQARDALWLFLDGVYRLGKQTSDVYAQS